MALIGITEGINAYGFPSFMGTGVTGYKVHLYTNNLTPIASNVKADFTEVTGDAAYTASIILLAPATWVFTATPPSTASYPQIVFNFTNTQTIYGYFVTDSGSSKVVWAERFAGVPITFGPTLPLYFTPVITLQ